MIKKFLKGIPVNRIIILSALVFMFQSLMTMYYNNNSLIFPNLETFNSFNKAEAITNLDFSGAFRDLPAKKWSNGPLYNLLIAPFYKLAGKGNVITIVFILDLILYILIMFLFYKVAAAISGDETAFLSTVLFGLSPPIMLGVFSGADVALSIFLFAGAFYNAYFNLPSKKYTGLIIFSILLLLNGLVPAVFGLAFIFYAVMKYNEKKLRKNYTIILVSVLALFIIVISVILGFVFIENLSPDYLKNSGLFDVKTWTVDAFFKDGFLWSKIAPPFFALFFYIALFVKLSDELKNKSAGIMTLTLFLAVAALLTGFFSTFAMQSKSYLYVSPFFFVMFIIGLNGLADFSKYMEQKKPVNFTAANIYYGFIFFMILYCAILSFNKTVEADNMIQYLTGDSSVSKYLER